MHTDLTERLGQADTAVAQKISGVAAGIRRTAARVAQELNEASGAVERAEHLRDDTAALLNRTAAVGADGRGSEQAVVARVVAAGRSVDEFGRLPRSPRGENSATDGRGVAALRKRTFGRLPRLRQHSVI